MISFRERDPVRVGIASLAGLAALMAFTFFWNQIPFIARNFELVAEFADAAGISPGNEIRIAGIKVGKVTKVALSEDRVLVTMRIDDETQIPRTAIAEINLNTILGTKYISVDATDPGPFFLDGERIPMSQTKVPFEIYQASNATVDLLQQIDVKQLNDGLRALADIADDPQRNVARTLEASGAATQAIASQSEALVSLIVKGDQLVTALDESSPDIQAVIGNSQRLLSVIAKRRATIKSLLVNTETFTRSLGGLLKDRRTDIDRILRDLHLTLTIVDRNLVEVEEALRLLGPSSESFARIAWTGPWANICVAALATSDEGGPGTGDDGPVSCRVP